MCKVLFVENEDKLLNSGVFQGLTLIIIGRVIYHIEAHVVVFAT